MRQPEHPWQVDVIGAACCLALTAATIPFGLMPIKHDAAEARALGADLDSGKSELDDLGRSRLSLQAQEEEARAELAGCMVQLQPLENLNARMVFLTELVDSSGLELQETELGSSIVGPRYRTVPIRISGSGDYAECTAFLHHLRKRAPDTGVAALELSGNPESDVDLASFTFDLVWYAASSLAAADE